MMKKTYKSSLLALSVLASFTSCSESESLQQANLSKDKITFHATLDNSWKPLSPASSSRAAIAAATEKGPIVVPTPFGKPLYLHPVVQDGIHIWSKEGKPITRSGAPLEDVEHERVAQTRGTMSTKTDLSDYQSFGVTAIYKDNGTNTALFTNQKASKNNEDIWEIEDKTNSRWPFDALVSFHAYAPFNDATDGMWSVTTDADNVKTKIKYTAKSGETEILSQPDIIVATNAESRSVSSDDKAVELKFSHALTAVNFAISKDLTDIFKTGATDGSKLKSITLSGIPNEGTCELTATEGAPQTPSQKWTFDTESDGAKKTGTYIFNLENKNITIGESYALTSNEDKNILMMIPQNLQGTKAQLTFVLDIKGKGDQTFTFDLSNQTWLPGTSVTYKLSASAVNHLENAEVKFPNSWKDTEQAKYSYPKTDFATGESIGLYVVNSNNTIEEENVKLTRDQDGKWMPENNNTKFLKLKNYKYFAYYPYNTIAPNVDATKDNADEFFKDKITNWNPVKEQNTEEVLLGQDLQVGEGIIDGDAATLTFNMAHSMGLAVLNLKAKEVPEKRTFTTNNYTYYYPELEGRATTEPAASEYTDATDKQSVEASTEFNGNIPFLAQTTDKRYVQIVKPNVAATFKAEDETDKPRTAWGTLKPYSLTVGKNQVVAKDITSDADFYYLARLFSYKKSTESFTVPVDGTYTLECWGAGVTKGGKSLGDYQAQKNQILYICVGGKGTNGSKSVRGVGGYNGGGNGGDSPGYTKGGGGSGATHICLQDGVLKDLKTAYDNNQLLMVAGGQGGSIGSADGPFGGGIEGGKPTSWSGTVHAAATQSSGYAFGTGQNGRNGTRNTNGGGEGSGGSGGGLYGGYAPQQTGYNSNSSGGGGSGYVNAVLVNGETIAGNQTFKSPSGVLETGHVGNGAALITWLP